MKINSQFFVKISILLFSILFLSSCQPDNNVEASIEGKYNCQETVAASGSTAASNSSFEIHVTSNSADNSSYKIENFYNIGFNKILTITYSNGNINIPEQNVDGFIIKGNGSVSSGKINFSYSAKDAGGSIENCTAVATIKQ